ncbi:MAG: Hint domain-containing protein [Rhodovulum sp.]
MATFYDLLEIADLPGVGDVLGPYSSPNMSIDFLGTEHTAEVADDGIGSEGTITHPAGFYVGTATTDISNPATIDGTTYATTGLWEVTYDFEGVTYSGHVIEATPEGGGDARYFFMPQDAVDPSEFGDVEILSMSAVTFIDESEGDSDDAISFVVCFAAGTRVATPAGPRAVETLRPGDAVLTLDGGVEPVLWAGETRVGAAAAMADRRLRAIEIGPGALAASLPECPLRVSRQHRVLIRSPIAARMFGSAEVLIAAAQLEGLPGIREAPVLGETVFVHLLLPDHAILLAEGVGAESLWLGPEACRFLGPDLTHVLSAMLDGPQRRARPFAERARARRLVKRHRKNDRPLWEGPVPMASLAFVPAGGAASGIEPAEPPNCV